jgi:serine/threonine-protein kinase
MSPEQVRGSRDVDARADIWALGLILQELVTATPVFRARNEEEVMVQVLKRTPMPLTLLRADAPPELERVVWRCLQQAREHRFANVREVATALAPFAPEWAEVNLQRLQRGGGAPSQSGYRRSGRHQRSSLLDGGWSGSSSGGGDLGKSAKPRRARTLLLVAGALVSVTALGATVLNGRHGVQERAASPGSAQPRISSGGSSAAATGAGPTGASPLAAENAPRPLVPSPLVPSLVLPTTSRSGMEQVERRGGRRGYPVQAATRPGKIRPAAPTVGRPAGARLVTDPLTLEAGGPPADVPGGDDPLDGRK